MSSEYQEAFCPATDSGSKRSKMVESLSFTINVRPYSSTYIARVAGENVQASCTMSEIAAAQTCAEKFCAKRKLKLISLLRYGRADTWILTATPDLQPVKP